MEKNKFLLAVQALKHGKHGIDAFVSEFGVDAILEENVERVYTILMLACKFKDDNAIDYIIQKGADVNLKRKMKMSSGHFGQDFGTINICALSCNTSRKESVLIKLLEAGADPYFMVDEYNNFTYFDLSVDRFKEIILKMALVKNAGIINENDNKNDIPRKTKSSL